MASKDMEASGNGKPESAYSIIAYPAIKLPVQYRNYVLAKFKRSLRHGNDYFKLWDANSYYEAYERYCQVLFNRPDAVIRLAVLTDDRDVALGFSLIERDILHYVFVQSEQRNKGIGKSLVPVPIAWITHLTNTGVRIWSSHPGPKFDPTL